jgi:hypothetical protein
MKTQNIFSKPRHNKPAGTQKLLILISSAIEERKIYSLFPFYLHELLSIKTHVIVFIYSLMYNALKVYLKFMYFLYYYISFTSVDI